MNKESQKYGVSKTTDFKKVLEKNDKAYGANVLYHEYEGIVEIKVNEDSIISTYETNYGTVASIKTVNSLKMENEQRINELKKTIGQKPGGFCFSDCTGYTQKKFDEESKKLKESLSKTLQSTTSKDGKKTYKVAAVLGVNLEEKPTNWKCIKSQLKE